MEIPVKVLLTLSWTVVTDYCIIAVNFNSIKLFVPVLGNYKLGAAVWNLLVDLLADLCSLDTVFPDRRKIYRGFLVLVRQAP